MSGAEGLETKTEKYRLGERIGSGGMAEVFRGELLWSPGFGRPVAIKRILPAYATDPEFRRMFHNEAAQASRLNHSNIVQVLDFAEGPELLLVMELVEGKDLKTLLEGGRLEPQVSVHIVAEVLRALDYAHHLVVGGRPLGLVHRDISPHNILISWRGDVKISDFGIAKAAAGTSRTATGMLKGKAAYMSPEQAQSQELDGRSDLFSLGVVLHELLSGERLFGVEQGAPDIVIVRRVLKHEIPRPKTLRPEVSAALEAVTLRLLERDRELRFASAGEALVALLDCPEATNRGHLELARLIRTRFSEEAPVSQPFVPAAPRAEPRASLPSVLEAPDLPGAASRGPLPSQSASATMPLDGLPGDSDEPPEVPTELADPRERASDRQGSPGVATELDGHWQQHPTRPVYRSELPTARLQAEPLPSLTPSTSAERPRPRSQWPLLLAIGVLLLIIGALVLLLLRNEQPPPRGELEPTSILLMADSGDRR